MNFQQKKHFCGLVLIFGFFSLILINAIFLQTPKAKASIGCGIDCWQENATTCKVDDTAYDNSMGCTINQPAIESQPFGGSSCSSGIGVGSKWCGQGTCPSGAKGLLTLNGARCDIYDSTVDITWPNCKEPFIVQTGKWDTSEGACVGCLEKFEVMLYGTQASISNTVVPQRCESACGADFDCDDKAFSQFLVGAPCVGQTKNYCDAGCSFFKACTTTCGGQAECDNKKTGAACTVGGNPGFCDGSCTCIPSCDGDNVKEGSEQCDGTDLGGQTCVSQGYSGGTLACKVDCTFNTSGCDACSGATVDGICPPGCTPVAGPKYDIDCGKWNCSVGSPNEALDCDTFASGGDCISFNGDSCGGPNVWTCSGNCDAPAYRNPPGNCSVFTESRQKACGCTCGPPPATCGPADGNCPVGCSNPPDPDCPATCVVSEAVEATCNDGLDNDCDGQADCADVGNCPNGTTCSGTNFCDTGACVECTTTNLTNCATGEVCTLGSCSPCKGDGDAASGLSQCCAGLNWIDGTCTSRCDPRISFYCNPLRGTVEDVVQGGQKLIGYVLGLVGSIALLFIVIAGMMYMTSAGNEEKIASSKKILTGAVIGIAITLLAYSFLQVIISILNM